MTRYLYMHACELRKIYVGLKMEVYFTIIYRIGIVVTGNNLTSAATKAPELVSRSILVNESTFL